MSAAEDGAAFRRVLLKLSGEALMGEREYGQDPARIAAIARAVRDVHELGTQQAIVVGGGNILRGTSEAAKGMDRATADYAGMLATLLNALTISDALEQLDLPTRVLSAITVSQVAEPYIRRRAIRHLEKGRVVIFGAGTGNPYFTTDSAAALRGLEIKAEVLLKATRVDGVYSADPVKDAKATRFERLTYQEVLERGLRVMDAAAISLCQENKLPIVVFDIRQDGNIRRVIAGEPIGSIVSE